MRKDLDFLFGLFFWLILVGPPLALFGGFWLGSLWGQSAIEREKRDARQARMIDAWELLSADHKAVAASLRRIEKQLEAMPPVK